MNGIAAVAERFVPLEQKVAKKKGEFSLFALVQRQDAPGRWDLVVSAPWIKEDRKATLDYLVRTIREDLGNHQLVELSRIVLLDAENPAVKAFNRAMHVEHGFAEVRESNFFGLPIEHAYIITSKHLSPSSAKKAAFAKPTKSRAKKGKKGSKGKKTNGG